MRLVILVISVFLFLVSHTSYAEENPVVTEGKNRKRIIILPHEPEEILSAEEGILKKLGERFSLSWKGYDKREGIDIKFRLYEDRDKKGRLEQRLEVKPKISGDPALRFVWKF